MDRSEYRRYDHRLKNLVATSVDIRKFLKYGISLSTLKEWKKNRAREFFTIPELELNTSELVAENMTLKAKLAAVTAEWGDFTRMSRSISRSLSHRPNGPKGRVVVISHWLNICQ